MVQMTDPKPGEVLFDPVCDTGGLPTRAKRHMRGQSVKRPVDEAAIQASPRAVEKNQLTHIHAVTNMLVHGIEDHSSLRHDTKLWSGCHSDAGGCRDRRCRAEAPTYARDSPIALRVATGGMPPPVMDDASVSVAARVRRRLDSGGSQPR